MYLNLISYWRYSFRHNLLAFSRSIEASVNPHGYITYYYTKGHRKRRPSFHEELKQNIGLFMKKELMLESIGFMPEEPDIWKISLHID